MRRKKRKVFSKQSAWKKMGLDFFRFSIFYFLFFFASSNFFESSSAKKKSLRFSGSSGAKILFAHSKQRNVLYLK